MTPFITYITRAHVSLHAFSFTEMIQIYVMIIFFIAFCFISPVMFYQLWAFIAPGLHNNERQFIYKYSFFSVLLFCAGVAFAFYVGFPIIIQFALKLSLTLNISPVIGFKAYLVELIRWHFIPIANIIHRTCKIRSYRYHIIEALSKIYLFRLLCAGKYHCTTRFNIKYITYIATHIAL